MVRLEGFEPPHFGLRVRCSTVGAIDARWCAGRDSNPQCILRHGFTDRLLHQFAYLRMWVHTVAYNTPVLNGHPNPASYSHGRSTARTMPSFAWHCVLVVHHVEAVGFQVKHGPTGPPRLSGEQSSRNSPTRSTPLSRRVQVTYLAYSPKKRERGTEGFGFTPKEPQNLPFS